MIQRVFIERNYPNNQYFRLRPFNYMRSPEGGLIPTCFEKVYYQESNLFITQAYNIETDQPTNQFCINLKINLEPSMVEMFLKLIKTNWSRNGIYSWYFKDTDAGYINYSYSFNNSLHEMIFDKNYYISEDTPLDEVFDQLMVELNSMQTSIQKSINTVLSNSPQSINK